MFETVLSNRADLLDGLSFKVGTFEDDLVLVRSGDPVLGHHIDDALV